MPQIIAVPQSVVSASRDFERVDGRQLQTPGSDETGSEVRRGERFRFARRKRAGADPRSGCSQFVQLDSLDRDGGSACLR
jgi:hypothetical protein